MSVPPLVKQYKIGSLVNPRVQRAVAKSPVRNFFKARSQGGSETYCKQVSIFTTKEGVSVLEFVPAKFRVFSNSSWFDEFCHSHPQNVCLDRLSGGHCECVFVMFVSFGMCAPPVKIQGVNNKFIITDSLRVVNPNGMSVLLPPYSESFYQIA